MVDNSGRNNDIGSAKTPGGADKIAAELIAAYDEMINKAHAKGILVYGATMLPFAGSFTIHLTARLPEMQSTNG